MGVPGKKSEGKKCVGEERMSFPGRRSEKERVCRGGMSG